MDKKRPAVGDVRHLVIRRAVVPILPDHLGWAYCYYRVRRGGAPCRRIGINLFRGGGASFCRCCGGIFWRGCNADGGADLAG